ncbi:MAG: hypothetical protein HY300_07780 [Verrucomicrobia bacterium]|nr:hypothetical protein [Verrucomicrobiota bacterium]
MLQYGSRMIKNGVSLGLMILFGLALGGCTKQEEPIVVNPIRTKPVTLAVVKEKERSRHFLEVSRQLELGGTLYGYVDIDGDVAKVASLVQQIAARVAVAQPAAAPYLKQDYAELFKLLGFADVKAMGFSSVPDGTGFFRNRTFLFMPEKRHGLLAGLGGEPGPFERVALAPANTDFYSESEIDLPVVYSTLRNVVAKVGGDPAADGMEAQLKRAGESAAFSLYSFIQGLKGRVTMVLRLEEQKEIRLPGPPGVVLPGTSLLICLDGVGPAVEAALAQAPGLKATQDGTLRLFELKEASPIEGLAPVFAIDGKSLYLATSVAFLKECRAGGTQGLAQRAEFREALGHVSAQGNSLAYVSPHFFQQLRRLETLNPHLPPEGAQLLDTVLRMLPTVDRPLVTVRSNLPNGILVQSYWDRSLKQGTLITPRAVWQCARCRGWRGCRRRRRAAPPAAQRSRARRWRARR